MSMFEEIADGKATPPALNAADRVPSAPLTGDR